MTDALNKITLFAADADEAETIRTAAGQLENVRFTSQANSLAQANGTAHALAAAGEIVLFRANGTDASELDAVRALCAAAGAGGGVIAISDADMPLARVRKLMQAGVADVLPMPVDPDDLKSCLSELRTPAAPAAETIGRGKVITVAQSRGGIGSTTLAVNLADTLRGKSGKFRKRPTKRVAIVDLDLQFGGIASFLDVEANDTLRQLAADGIVPDATFVAQAVVHSADGLAVLTAPTDFVPLESLSRDQVDALIDQLSLQFDFVVVDLPRTLVHWVQAVLNRSDQLYLVTDSTVPAIRQSKRLIDAYTEENPTLPVEVVVNFEAKPMIRGRHHVQAAKLLERDLTHWLPSDPKTTREALDRGVPLTKVSARSRLSRAIGKMADDVAKRPATAPSHELAQHADLTFTSRKSKEGIARV